MTRRDLPPGAQIAQSLHAFREFLAKYPAEELEWYQNSNYIAVLAAKDELELKALIERLEKKKIKYAFFREEAFDNEITAVAIEPGDRGRRVTSGFPLALRDVQC